MHFCSNVVKRTSTYFGNRCIKNKNNAFNVYFLYFMLVLVPFLIKNHYNMLTLFILLKQLYGLRGKDIGPIFLPSNTPPVKN